MEKQKVINAELQAKIDALRKAQPGNNNQESVNGYTYESLGGILKKSFENIEKTAWAQKYPNIVKSYKVDIIELAFDALEDNLTPLTPEQFMDEINSGNQQGTKLEDYKNNLIEHQNLLADIESGKVSYTRIHGIGRGGGKKGSIATVKEWIADDKDAIATNGIGTTDFMQSYKSYLENIIATKTKEYLNNNSSDKGDKEKQDFALVDQTSNKLSQIDPSIQTGIENELEKLSDPNAKKAKKEVTRKIEKHEIDPPAPEALTVTRMAIPGRTQAEEANYEVIEADDVQASHLPEAGFQRNPKYGLENERRYHAEPDSQAKVLRNAVDLNPDFVLRDSVDANQGAPVIDQDNNVLGGNGRAMSIRKAYITGGEKANLYRKALMVRAAQLGISAAKIEAMKHPMLVRRLATAYSKEERQRLVSQLNDTFTDTKNARMSGKSRGDRFGKKTLDLLGQGMQNADTLRQFFDLPDSRVAVESLIDDGVIQQTERNAYVSPDGLLNPDGKRVVEEALRGRMARKYETLASIPGDVLAKLDAVAPSIIIAETIGGDWNLTEHIRDAVDLLAEYKNSPFCKKDDFHTFLKNMDMMKGVAPVDRYSKVSIQIFLMLIEVKKGELIKRFRKYAFDAQNISQDTGALPGISVTAQQSALKNLNIDLGSSNTQTASQRQTSPQPAIPACVNDLNDILSGKYDADSDKVMELLESSLTELENKGLLPTYEKLLNDASDHLTELLEKEVVL